MQALAKTPRGIDRLQKAETCFAKMSEPSFKNFSERLFTPAALELLISYIIFKTCFSVVSTKQKPGAIAKPE